MPLLPGAEPLRHDGSEVGVLLCHGFTGTPHALRPWAHHLADQGLTVSLPLLPGHGTRWQDLQVTGWQDWYAAVDRELRRLTERCERVVVGGLSMGGTLALRLAARHGTAVSGLVLVNPAMTFPRWSGYALPVLRHLLPSTRGIANDVARDGVEELGYPRVPLHAAHSLRELFRLTTAELPQVTQPLLLMHTRTDHVVPPSDSALILSRVSATDVTETWLEDSYHVATLDHDARRILTDSHAFVTRVTTERNREGHSARA